MFKILFSKPKITFQETLKSAKFNYREIRKVGEIKFEDIIKNCYHKKENSKQIISLSSNDIFVLKIKNYRFLNILSFQSILIKFNILIL